jgi:dihydrofolate reductase
MMQSFWCSDQAMQQMPEITIGMHESPKYIFSRSLQKTDWENSALIKEDMIDFVRKLKQTEGPDLTILGSGEILAQLADAGLVDGYDIMLDPVILGEGVTIFQGIRKNQNLKLLSQRNFKNGAMLLSYEVRST